MQETNINNVYITFRYTFLRKCILVKATLRPRKWKSVNCRLHSLYSHNIRRYFQYVTHIASNQHGVSTVFGTMVQYFNDTGILRSNYYFKNTCYLLRFAPKPVTRRMRYFSLLT